MSNMHDAAAFREQYRAYVQSRYNGWLHLVNVLVISLTVAIYCILQIRGLKGSELLVIPLGILAYNFVEYVSHRWVGHKKLQLTKLFYKRHTGDHHSFFSAPLLSFESPRDWRIVLFPIYLTAFIAFFLAPLCGFFLTWVVSGNMGYIMTATMILNHLAFELLHVGYHEPKEHWFHKVPVFRELAHLHRIHHHRGLMKAYNFNLTFPLFDILLGTFYWEPLESFDDFRD
ncbi:sterol desaturase family protein [Microbulbifer sp. OS29]|uniref:Sterol desaturase family protein n=1 Tax=Microbulbifer okhotskensis TaxID=2926617 RepID=A0A9X2ELJ4_9GAMM|nr:sterol desaturase family protein [Microbulbifer okhotskensis]MCO1334459.1 sterol desaturase family protein [Microbulbifer okhotskensis]